MEARSRYSRAPVPSLTFSLQRSHSPTHHPSSPSSSSSAYNLPVHRTPSPTPAAFSAMSSYSSSGSTAASCTINFPLDRPSSQVRSAGRPISPKGGAARKSNPCAPPSKTCMCSPTNHPAECEKVCHGKFAGKNRWCGRRIGEKSPHGSHTPLQPPHEKENVFPAPAQQAFPYDQCPRCLLRLALALLCLKIPFWPVWPIIPLMADE